MKQHLLKKYLKLAFLALLLTTVACQSSGSALPEAQPIAVGEQQLTPSSFATPTLAEPATPVGPPPLNFDNYQSFHSLYTWDVGGDVLSVTGIAISQAADEIALLTLRSEEEYRLDVLDLRGKLLWETPLHDKAAYPAIAFSPDGTMIATGTDNGEVKLWNVSDGSLIRLLGRHRYSVRVVVFSPDGALLASGASDNEVGLWHTASGTQVPTCFYWDPANKAKCRPQNKTDVRGLAFSTDGRYLAVTANVAVILDTSTGIEADRFYDSTTDTQNLAEVAFSPDGQGFAASGDWFNPGNNQWRKRILIWSFPVTNNQPKLVPLDDALEDLVFSSDGRLILGSYKDKGLLMIFDIVSRMPVANINLGPITLMSYSPDLSEFAVLANKTSVSIWAAAR